MRIDTEIVSNGPNSIGYRSYFSDYWPTFVGISSIDRKHKIRAHEPPKKQQEEEATKTDGKGKAVSQSNERTLCIDCARKKITENSCQDQGE